MFAALSLLARLRRAQQPEQARSRPTATGRPSASRRAMSSSACPRSRRNPQRSRARRRGARRGRSRPASRRRRRDERRLLGAARRARHAATTRGYYDDPLLLARRHALAPAAASATGAAAAGLGSGLGLPETRDFEREVAMLIRDRKSGAVAVRGARQQRRPVERRQRLPAAGDVRRGAEGLPADRRRTRAASPCRCDALTTSNLVSRSVPRPSRDQRAQVAFPARQLAQRRLPLRRRGAVVHARRRRRS